jgi:lysophospholipase L1-like esterase
LAVQTNYISGPGDFTGAASVPTIATTTTWPFLTEVDVITPSLGATVVALGDSLTDGLATTNDANQRWPDFLARRLQANRETFAPAGGNLPGPLGQLAMGRKFGIVNRGLNGNRLLRDFDGTAVSLAGLVRFDRDVLASAGAEYVIVLLGINDIGVAGLVPGEVPVTADELVAGYRQLIARAHTRGLIIFGGTLTPFEGSSPGYYTPEKEQVRQAVNQWLRTSNEFDAVIDFDRAIRDPDQPSRMLPAFDSGDHLHPSDLGMQALANAVPLEFFHGAGSADLKKKLRK